MRKFFPLKLRKHSISAVEGAGAATVLWKRFCRTKPNNSRFSQEYFHCVKIPLRYSQYLVIFHSAILEPTLGQSSAQSCKLSLLSSFVAAVARIRQNVATMCRRAADNFFRGSFEVHQRKYLFLWNNIFFLDIFHKYLFFSWSLPRCATLTCT